MKHGIPILIIFFFFGCSEQHRFEDFASTDPEKGKEVFYQDSQVCEGEKNRHSAKIQGRELGFKGEDTAFLGCMQVKGWSQKPRK